jgi:hypothetical protein
MRTLQEKYNAIQEGKFSKEHFLAEARMQQPQIITRFNGYDDAVQILKNKGMIQEIASFAERFKEYSNDALTDMIINLSRYQGNEKEIEEVKAELARRKENINEATSNTRKVGDKVSVYGTNKSTHLYSGEILSIDGDNITVGKFSGTRPSTGEKSITVPSSRVKSGKDLSIKEARLTKKNLTDYRYKPTNDMDKYPYEQILRGIRVELEGLGVHGTPTAEEYSKALAKVSKNLAKDSIYYTNQVAGVNPNVDLHDQMVDATAKNTVDTFNGMKKAALKEGFKKLIKKVLTETVVDVEDYNGEEDEIYEMQEAKEDSYYKSELADYLDDNGIFGFTNRIHDIMTGPDEAENVDELVRYLEDNQIYGYNRGIEAIYADYPYDQHWMNQPDENEADDISHPRGYEEASDAETEEDLYETRKAKSLSELLK